MTSNHASIGFERFILHAVESHLRGNEWNSILSPFFTTNTPRFQTFGSLRNVATGTYTDIDIQMHLVHVEFKTLVEDELQHIIARMGSTEERFAELIALELPAGDETVARLYSTLTSYQDFVSFGKMMQEKCYELYPGESAVKTFNAGVRRIKICRVLWDVENVPVDPALGGIQTVLALQKFLRTKGLWGNGVDTRITAFFNPFNKSVPKKVIEQLNKASVELVCASAKREDSDRKLGIRINQEMQLLLPELTTFVVISSDQDFRQHLQLLHNAGYATVVVHQARNEDWRQTLEMQAGTGVQWSEVLACWPPGAARDTAETRTEEDAAKVIQKAFKKQPPAALPTAEAQQGQTSTGSLQRDFTLESAALGWRVAVCQRWASAYGFLLVDVAHPEVSGDFTLAAPSRLRDADVRIDNGRRGRGRKANTITQADQETSITSDDASGSSGSGISNTGNKSNPAHTGHTGHPSGGSSSVVRVYVHHSALTHKPAGRRMLRAAEYVLAQVVADPKGPRAAVVRDLFPHQVSEPTAFAPQDEKEKDS